MHPQLPLNLDAGQSPGFDAFWPGRNTLLIDVLKHLASAQSADSQVYISGASGAGKTHLLSATCERAAAQGYTIAYLPAQLIGAADSLLGYDRYDLVCIDDLHAMPCNTGSELSLFGLINGLRNSGGRLLLSARCPVADLPVALPDLKTRLGWGAVYALSSVPEEELGLALAMRADYLGIPLPIEVIDFLLRRNARDLASMLEILDRLKLASAQAKRKITIPFAREVLASACP